MPRVHRRTTQAIIFFFIWAEKSLRRARKQRRSESVEAPVDVASAARSEYIDAPSSHYDELESGARSPVNT